MKEFGAGEFWGVLAEGEPLPPLPQDEHRITLSLCQRPRDFKKSWPQLTKAIGGTSMTLWIRREASLRRSVATSEAHEDFVEPRIGDPNESRAELSRLLTTSLKSNTDLAAADKTYVAQVVAQRTGLSQADAEKRVDEILIKVKADLDAARKAALKLSLWLVASLLIGAFSASIAAAEAGGFRDRNWRTL